MKAVSTVDYEITEYETERLLSKIEYDTIGGCWLWSAYTNDDGYGVFTVAGPRWLLAHRAAYTALVRRVPDDMTVDHKCRVRCCINPDHLRVVTKRRNVLENSASAPAANAAKTHCKRGHPFTPENTYVRPDVKPGNSSRDCVACRTDRDRRRRAVLASLRCTEV